MRRVLIQIAAALALSGPAWAQATDAERYYGWGPHMMGWSGGWHAMIFGPLFMILFLAVLVAIAVFLFRCSRPWQGIIQPHRFPPVRTPLDMLIAHTETLKVGAIGR